MGFNCGIVGLPNVGKSTLFNALTNADVAAENYPFCTIEPHVGVVPVPDMRLDTIAKLAQSEKTVPTVLEFVDIAGLVRGASEGEGLGNQFLENIRRTQAILHVVRCFEDDNVVHVGSGVDPVSDAETIDTELMLADLAVVERALEKAGKLLRSGDKDLRARCDLLARLRDALAQGRAVRNEKVSDAERVMMGEWNLLTAKPMLLVANIQEGGEREGNRHLSALRAYASERGLRVSVLSAVFLAGLAGLSADEQREFLDDVGMEKSGLREIIEQGYGLLDLLTFFTAGPKEARAWTVKAQACAPQAAGCIHSDFERGFICAETVSYDDFVEHSGWHGAKEAGKVRTEGKDYTVCEADIMHFRFNV